MAVKLTLQLIRKLLASRMITEKKQAMKLPYIFKLLIIRNFKYYNFPVRFSPF